MEPPLEVLFVGLHGAPGGQHLDAAGRAQWRRRARAAQQVRRPARGEQVSLTGGQGEQRGAAAALGPIVRLARG